jgi:hypothetical protein
VRKSFVGIVQLAHERIFAQRIRMLGSCRTRAARDAALDLIRTLTDAMRALSDAIRTLTDPIRGSDDRASTRSTLAALARTLPSAARDRAPACFVDFRARR